jgi:hypothetical protein
MADVWKRLRPRDVRPWLLLMDAYEGRNALRMASDALATAEQLDPLGAEVRQARLRLVVKTAQRHVQNGKPHLLVSDLAELEHLLQTRGTAPLRSALLPALQSLLAQRLGQPQEAAAQATEAAAVCGRVPAAILISALGMRPKIRAFLPLLDSLTLDERRGLPLSVARTRLFAEEIDCEFALPAEWSRTMLEVIRKPDHEPLSGKELLALAPFSRNLPELGYCASTLGLGRFPELQTDFLLMRARVLPPPQTWRRNRCIAAAGRLGEERREPGVWEKIQAIPVYGESRLDITLEDAREVLRREKNAPDWPSLQKPGPDYADLELPARPGSNPSDDDYEFDDDDPDGEFPDFEEFLPGVAVPPDMPPELAKAVFQAMREAQRAGMSEQEFFSGLNELFDRLVGPAPQKKPNKKGGPR